MGRLLEEGGRLLALLAGPSARLSFQTFDEAPARRPDLAKILHGSLDKLAPILGDLNERGASVNFMVNEGDGRGRAKENVLAVRALFVDLDGDPLQPVLDGPLPPHAVVQSSPGRYHAYWLVEGVGLGDFTPLQRAIAERFGGDRTVVDLPRVMRLPGSLHHKHGATPCQLVTLDEGRPRYGRAEVLEAFAVQLGAPAKASQRLVPLADGIPEGERNRTLFDLARSFVNKGLPDSEVASRIQKVNATKCQPPLCATEVDAIVASAIGYGPSGYLNLPIRVFDCPAYRKLSHAARTVTAAAYRRYNGQNNGAIALPFSEFAAEFSRSQTFYKARAEAVRSGLLRRVRKRRYHEWGGRQPDLYEVALEPPSVHSMERKAVI